MPSPGLQFPIVPSALRPILLLAAAALLLGFQAAHSFADSIDWNTRPATDLRSGGTDTITFGSASETTAVVSGSYTGSFDAAGVIDIEPSGSHNGNVGIGRSTMDASNSTGATSQTIRVDFNELVYDVQLHVIDIDGGPATGQGWNDIVEFRGLSPSNATVLPTTGTPTDSAKVIWDSGTGEARANNYVISDNTGDVVVTFAGPIKTLTIRHIAAQIVDLGGNPNQQVVSLETITFKRAPRITISQTSSGGTSTFDTTISNGLNMPGQASAWSSTTLSSSITTVAPGTPVNGSVNTLYATATATALVQTAPASGWNISAATCTDSNSGVSGNPPSFGTYSGQTVTIPAGNVLAGAEINCAITNTAASASLAVSVSPDVGNVSAAGQVVTYAITVSNTGGVALSTIAVSDPLGTITCATSGNATIAALAAGASENCSLTYSVPQSAFDTNGGGDGDIDNTATASTTYGGSPVSASGSSAVTVSVLPGIDIDKQASTAGPVHRDDAIAYSYTVTNTGNVTLHNVVVNDNHNGFGTAPDPGNETLQADNGPTGDSVDSATNGTWDSLAPGDVVVFSGAYNVVQADVDLLQ